MRNERLKKEHNRGGSCYPPYIYCSIYGRVKLLGISSLYSAVEPIGAELCEARIYDTLSCRSSSKKKKKKKRCSKIKVGGGYIVGCHGLK